MRELNAIAERDFFKFARGRNRLIWLLVFPFVLLFLFGGAMQLNLGAAAGFNLIAFTFSGVLGMTVFQSSMQGLASLLDDRQNDFAQENSVSPISRFTIVFGKITGEPLVALAQAIPLVVFAVVLRVPLSPWQAELLVPVAILSCLLGGAFGLVAMALINTQQAANQIFNLLLLRQLFLAGVFAPIERLPWYPVVLSRLSPMRSVVDLFRDILYMGQATYQRVVLVGPLTNLVIVVLMFAAFLLAGTALFVRRETNR